MLSVCFALRLGLRLGQHHQPSAVTSDRSGIARASPIPRTDDPAPPPRHCGLQGWMKTNNNMISSYDPCLKADTSEGSYAASWASYFVKWIQGMASAGVTINAVTVQNEPGYKPANYEGCMYNSTEHRDFVKNHLGPTLKGAFPGVQVRQPAASMRRHRAVKGRRMYVWVVAEHPKCVSIDRPSLTPSSALNCIAAVGLRLQQGRRC